MLQERRQFAITISMRGPRMRSNIGPKNVHKPLTDTLLMKFRLASVLYALGCMVMGSHGKGAHGSHNTEQLRAVLPCYIPTRWYISLDTESWPALFVHYHMSVLHSTWRGCSSSASSLDQMQPQGGEGVLNSHFAMSWTTFTNSGYKAVAAIPRWSNPQACAFGKIGESRGRQAQVPKRSRKAHQGTCDAAGKTSKGSTVSRIALISRLTSIVKRVHMQTRDR